LPGLFIDSAPFRTRHDAALTRILEMLRAAIDPDAIELLFLFHPERRHYRRRFLGKHTSGARPLRAAPAPPDPSALSVAFSAPGLVEGDLRLHRRRRRPWTGAERMRFELLRPFVAQILEQAARNEIDRTARGRLLAALERTESPMLILDGSGTILFANEAADALLSRQTEEGLAVLAGDRGTTPLLSHLIRLAAGCATECRVHMALSNGRSLEARLTAVDEGGEPPSPVRVVTLLERAPIVLDDIRPLLSARGVSDREAEVIGGVLRGLRNAQIAGELFISEYTVKDHLKHVFAKLGVSSRGGLIRAMYASPS